MAAPKGLKFLLFGMGPKFHATAAFVLEILALAALVIGIVSGVKYEAIFELWSTEYFLISIALFIWGFWSWLCAYFASKD